VAWRVLNGGVMRIAAAAVPALCLSAACVATDAAAPAPQPDPPGDSCPEPAGRLTIFAIPPPIALDWTTPNTLLQAVQASRDAGKDLVAAGAAVMGRSIGHVVMELDCGGDSIRLTGQTGGGEDWPAATDGAGLLLRDTPGAMDDMPTGDPEKTPADVAARQASGNVTRISFVVNQATCKRIKSFVDAYIASGAYVHYDGAFRPRRMEGAGCAIFGAGVIDVAGLLRRSLFTPAWARTEMIGSARIADFLGDGKYAYGGNLVARDADGTSWIWPRGADVPVSATKPVVIYSPVLDAWSGPEDAPFAVPGLAGKMRTQLPFTIYDPELMAEWAEGVWTEASHRGAAESLGVTWTAGAVEHAHEVTYDASCIAPQTIPFEADNDDLFEDSDAP
jgi:hypothetical protein